MRVVFLHALPLDGRMWDDTIDALGCDAIAPDLFDLGDSIQEWASAVLHDVGPDEFVVVGCSVGGSCALEIAARAPEQVAAIVLVGAKADVNPDPRFRDDAIRMLETEGMLSAWRKYWLPLFAPTTPSSIIESARASATDQDIGSIVNGVRAFHNRRDLSSFAARWDRPLIGISGDHDFAPSPSKVRKIATGPNRHFHLVANSGHYVNLEQPTAFEALIADAVRPRGDRPSPPRSNTAADN